MDLAEKPADAVSKQDKKQEKENKVKTDKMQEKEKKVKTDNKQEKETKATAAGQSGRKRVTKVHGSGTM